MAWHHISPEVTEGLKKCCMSTTLARTDDMLWNGSEKAWNVRSDCEEDESTDCEVGDHDTL
jgi:hypothetical protein